MRRSAIETVIGAVVLVVAAIFLYFTYNSGYQHADGYQVTAKFNRIDGLALGSEVRLSGIRVGRVIGERLDPETYLAIVKLSVDQGVKLPVDTTAKITSDSLLGSFYISLEPGADDKLIPDGGQIVATQDPINIGDLIGRYIFGSAGGAKKPKADQGQPPSGGQSSNGQTPGGQSSGSQSGGQ
jgi:phospholipid/cholesterol/gamma-HCH transport system substrate-binding protein